LLHNKKGGTAPLSDRGLTKIELSLGQKRKKKKKKAKKSAWSEKGIKRKTADTEEAVEIHQGEGENRCEQNRKLAFTKTEGGGTEQEMTVRRKYV